MWTDADEVPTEVEVPRLGRLGSVRNMQWFSAGASSGTARARIARYGARHAHSSPTHHDHASDEPPTHEWPDVSDNDDCDEDNDDDDLHHVDGQPGQSSRTLLLSDGADLKDTRV